MLSHVSAALLTNHFDLATCSNVMSRLEPGFKFARFCIVKRRHIDNYCTERDRAIVSTTEPMRNIHFCFAFLNTHIRDHSFFVKLPRYFALVEAGRAGFFINIGTTCNGLCGIFFRLIQKGR